MYAIRSYYGIAAAELLERHQHGGAVQQALGDRGPFTRAAQQLRRRVTELDLGQRAARIDGIQRLARDPTSYNFV